MGPKGRRRGGDEIGDARAVLGDADSVTAARASVAVGHVAGALLMSRGDEADARGREKIQRIHIGGANDAEYAFDLMGDKGLDESLARGHAGHSALQG